jgi:hypothetical protein
MIVTSVISDIQSTFHRELYELLLLLLLLLQMSFHSVAVVLTIVETKETRINIHQRNNKKHSTISTKHTTRSYITKTSTQLSKHPHIHPHITKPTYTHTHTLQHPHTHTL